MFHLALANNDERKLVHFCTIAFCNFLACDHSVIAHFRVTSGPNMADNMAPNRSTIKRKGLAPLGGTFRWIETQVESMRVEAHVHTISARLRVLGQSQRPVSGLGWSHGARRRRCGVNGIGAVGDVGDPVECAIKTSSANRSMGNVQLWGEEDVHTYIFILCRSCSSRCCCCACSS